jgi:septum formation protein
VSQKIYLASKSPRRQELLTLMNLPYELLLKDIDESFPSDLALERVAEYIAEKKAAAFEPINDGILITADTVVLIDGEILGKPIDEADAFNMLSKLNGKEHLVITGVTLKSATKIYSFSDTTKVTFSQLTEEQLWFYIKNYQPFDKAGSYGIQDWIGVLGVKSINGSYTNVMGLPTERLYKELNKFS